MPKRPHKFKLLFDENLESRELFPKLNNFHNIRNIVKDYKKSGLKDSEVFELSEKEKRILVTYNYKDFNNFPLSEAVGVIGISHTLTIGEIDKKLMSFLRTKTENDLYSKKYFISGETK